MKFILSLLLLLAFSPAFAQNMSFQNVTTQSLDVILDSNYRFDAVWNDFNNDGCYDIFVFGHGDFTTSRYWMNKCDGSNTFINVSNDTMHFFIPLPENPRGSGWITLIDANGDGIQDYTMWDAYNQSATYINGTKTPTYPTFLNKIVACSEHCFFGIINNDDIVDVIHEDRSITNITNNTQTYPAAGTAGLRVIGDINNDSWSDLVQPAAGGVWMNNQGTLSWVTAPIVGNMQFVLADFDNDGNLDLFTYLGNDATNSGQAHLYKGNGQGGFTEVTATSGLSALQFTAYFTNYGNAVAADMDNDGLQDLVIAGENYSSSVIIVKNLGNMQFQILRNVSLGPSGTDSDSFKARVTVADYDNDGKLDILKTQSATNVGIWKNTTVLTGRHWLNVRIVGNGSNTNGLGTTVKLLVPNTSQLISDMQVGANEWHQQTNLHFGTNANTTVDLQIKLPHGGATYLYHNIPVDQEIKAYPNGCIKQNWRPVPPIADASNVTATCVNPS